MTTVTQEVRKRVEFYTFGMPMRGSVRDKLIQELTNIVDDAYERGREQGRTEALDELADIVTALQVAAAEPEGTSDG